MNNKEFYKDWLNEVLTRYGMNGGLIHSTYERAIESGDFNACYIDDRVTIKGKRQFKKDMAAILDSYFNEYPDSRKPLYSYK